MNPFEGAVLFAELVALSAAGLGIAAIASGLGRRLPTLSRLLWTVVCADAGLLLTGCALFPFLGPRWGSVSTIVVLTVVSSLIATTRRILLTLAMVLALVSGAYLGLQQWEHTRPSDAELDAAIEAVGVPAGFHEVHRERTEGFSGTSDVGRQYSGGRIPPEGAYIKRLEDAGFADTQRLSRDGWRLVVGSSWWRRVSLSEQDDTASGLIRLSATPLGIAAAASQDITGNPKPHETPWWRVAVIAAVLALVLGESRSSHRRRAA